MKKIILIAGLIVLTAAMSFADSIIVDCNGGGDYTTIQAGINAAQDGDVVWVLDGVYYENNLSWQNKHITVRSLYGPANCIIEGNGYNDQYRAFNLTDSLINSEDLIYGFTIRNFIFHENCGIQKGAVILCDNGASPTISNCIIEDNEYKNTDGPDHYGLGLAIYCSGNTIVENCIIRNNTGIDIEGGVAIACKDDVMIENNQIYSNEILSYLGYTTEVARQGIAIYIAADDECSPTIKNNTIYNNDYFTYAAGEADLLYAEFDISWNYNDDPIEINNNVIYTNTSQNIIHLTDNAEIVICNNMMYENTCDNYCGGILISHNGGYTSSDSYTIDNNTIVDNDCYAAIYLYDSGYYNGIYNNIIAYNIGYGIKWNTGTEQLIVGYSDLYENSLGNYDLPPSQEIHCLQVDPVFTNRANDDYTLKWDANDFSPCIDTGHPGAQYEDADGTPADMGAIPVASHDYFKDDYDGEEFDNVDWMSFPVFNRTTNGWMDALHELERQELIFPGYPNDDILYRVVFENDEKIYFSSNSWINVLQSNGEFDSKQGYKIQLKEQYDNIPMKGISGTWLDESTKIALLAEQENWVGCFLREPAAFTDAFDSIWDEWSAVYSEHWAVERPEPGTTPCIVDSLTVNPGELYIIEVYEECELVWNESSPPVPPKTREMTDHFTYTEKLNYMAIDVDTVYSDTTVLEIAVFNDDQCIGASKVYDNKYPVQILAYTPESLKNGNNLEFRLYHEGQKSIPTKSIPYVRYNREVQGFVLEPIYYERNAFATVKLNTDEPSYTQKIQLLQNYPNPVRSNMTTIRFMPEQNAVHTELNIYNIRGQLVRSIDCDEIISSGSKNGYYTTIWDCRNSYGKEVKNGIYFYKLTSGKKSVFHKMLLMK